VLFLARFILKGQSQAALVAATMAMLGLLFPPAAWISAAVIVLVTLVNGAQRGLFTIALSLLGTALFAFVIFATPQVAIIFVLLAWLPAWMVAAILRQTVSLAYSLQILTAVCLLAVALIYMLYPDFGELWREPLDQMVSQLAQQSSEMTLAELQTTANWIIEFLPGLFVSSIMLGTLVSVLIGRWWQAVFYNPGGFGKEFRELNLGRISAVIAIVIIVMAMLANSIFAFALLAVIFVLYGIQALSLLHAIVHIRQLNSMWLFVFYIILFFIPHVLLLLVLLGLFDPWMDIRRRIAA
jgi:hypothetical protein